MLPSQVELHYPPASQRPPPAAAAADSAASGAPKVPAPRPSFADVLAASLVPTSEMRAWYSEERGYQALRQTRVPLTLPQVPCPSLTLNPKSQILNAVRPPGSWHSACSRPWGSTDLGVGQCHVLPFQ